MKKKVLSIFMVLLFAISFTGCSSSNTGNTNGNSNGDTGSQAPAVSIENFSFKPSALTVQVGTTVVWTNNDTAVHSIKSASFNSPEMKKGDTFKFTFEKAGTYDYSCGIHPTMTGQIIVVEKSGSSY